MTDERITDEDLSFMVASADKYAWRESPFILGALAELQERRAAERAVHDGAEAAWEMDQVRMEIMSSTRAVYIAGYAAGKGARLDVTAAVAYQEGRRESDDRLEDAATPPE